MKKRKRAGGANPKPKNEVRNIRIVTLVSENDIAQDNGMKRYLEAMNREMDRRLKS